jgi:hypothetical protein
MVYARCPWSDSWFRKWWNQGRFVVPLCGQQVKRTIVWKWMCIPLYVSIVHILVWVRFCTGVVTQLQLWHRDWLVSVQCTGDLLSQCLNVLHFKPQGRVVLIVAAHYCLGDVDQDNVARISIITASRYYMHRGLRACSSISRLFDHPRVPLYTVCRLEISSKALYRCDSTFYVTSTLWWHVS